MKKAIYVAAIVVLGAGVATAFSLNVPFYLDQVNDAEKAFVGVHNNLDTELVVGLIYYSENGVQLAYDPGVETGNTVAIPPKTSVSFRPVDSALNIDEGALANSVPDRPRWSGAAPGGDTRENGSIEISWDDGGPDALQGRVAQYSVAGNASTAHAFLLPAGTEAAK